MYFTSTPKPNNGSENVSPKSVSVRNKSLLTSHHVITSYDIGLPFEITIRCLHSLLKFDLSNLPPAVIKPSSSIKRSDS